MPEFLELLPPDEAKKRFVGQMAVELVTLTEETISLDEAPGRVLSQSIHAPHPLPTFDRSAVDGYAVKAHETYGASDSLPVYLRLLPAEVPMGAAPEFILPSGACAGIHTGGMLPDGADAVVMLEYTAMAGPGMLEVMRPTAPGENILQRGEDVKEGELVIPGGKLLRPAEIGGLAALGIVQIPVVRKPRVAILSTGDEVAPAEQAIQSGQVRDVNTHTLAALVRQNGGVPLTFPIVPDQAAAFEQAARQALTAADMLVITAGSSASARDLTAGVINALGKPGVLVHGVNVRPGKPTILGMCDGKPVIGLPGNPVSALVIASLFVIPAMETLITSSWARLEGGVNAASKLTSSDSIADRAGSITATLTTNVASQAGREDWVAVQLEKDENGWLAAPVFSKSNLIFGLVRADGLVRIPPSANGLPAGAQVQVVRI